MSQPLSLLGNRRFWPLFWAQFLGAFNDNFLKNAAVILITYGGRPVWGLEPEAMSTFAPALLMAPFLLFSAIAGQLADRCSKTWLTRRVKLVEVFLMLLAGVGFLAHQPGLLLLTILLLGLQATFFGPLKYSILPQLLRDDELVAGNALVEMGTNLAILLGTILGGILISSQKFGLVAVTVGLVVCALAGWVSTLFLVPTQPEAPDLRVELNPVTTTWKICMSVVQSRPILLSILAISWFWLFGSALLGLFLPYAKDVLRADEHVVTLFLALFSIGVGVGSIACERLSFERLELGLVPLGSIGMSLFAADLCLAWVPDAVPSKELLGVAAFAAHPGGTRVIVDMLLLSIFSGFFIVPLYTFIQSHAEPGMRSRIIAVTNIVSSLFVIGWAAIQIVLITFMPVTVIFLLVALLNALVALYIYLLIPEFVLRFLAWMLVNVIYRVRVARPANVPRDGGALLVSNHVSLVDWLVIYGSIKRPVRFALWHGYMRIPVIRTLLRHALVIPMASKEEDPDLHEQGLARIRAEIAAGNLVCMFPEGEATRDGGLGPFRQAIEPVVGGTASPVVPLAIRGLWGSIFSLKDKGKARNPLRHVWSRVELACGSPVESAKATTGLLRDAVETLLGDKNTPGNKQEPGGLPGNFISSDSVG